MRRRERSILRFRSMHSYSRTCFRSRGGYNSWRAPQSDWSDERLKIDTIESSDDRAGQHCAKSVGFMSRDARSTHETPVRTYSAQRAHRARIQMPGVYRRRHYEGEPGRMYGSSLSRSSYNIRCWNPVCASPAYSRRSPSRRPRYSEAIRRGRQEAPPTAIPMMRTATRPLATGSGSHGPFWQVSYDWGRHPPWPRLKSPALRACDRGRIL